jgi:hypothetical protein
MEKEQIKKYRQELKDRVAELSNQEIQPGIIIKTIGYKYITLLSLWNGAHFIKCCYDCFDSGDYGHCKHV